ncbi:MAG: panthothenate synthetase [Bryobacteraceae bacterium]
MQFLVHLQFPVEPFNSYVRDGSIGGKIEKIMASIKPEAAYFTEHHGTRGALLVVNVKNASDIPAIAEPWFLQFEADVEFRIAMTPQDLGKAGLPKLGKTWGDL